MKSLTLVPLALAAVSAAALAQGGAHHASHSEKPRMAVAVLHPTRGNQVEGTIRFTTEAGGVRVKGEVRNLAPGDHGFHIHENGDCSADDGTSAGGHFNPQAMPHAARDAGRRHGGDLGNITADASGRATIDFLDAHLALDGAGSIIGRGVIVHANKDDFTTQPTGNAGGRVACGVIGLTAPKKP
jgi:Cu-Zn family superoxide dismutase